jgi:hypothetical protein
MLANTKRLEWRGYYLLTPEEVGKSHFYYLAWYDAQYRQRRTRSTEQTDAGEAFAFLMRFAQKHPLPAGSIEAVDTGCARGTMGEALKNATAEAQELIDSIARRATDIVETGGGLKRLEPAADLPLRTVMAVYRAMRPHLANPTRPAESLAHAVDAWGVDVTVTQMDGPAQHLLINRMRAIKRKTDGKRRYTDQTITTRLACIWSAMHCCANEIGMLSKDAIHSRVPTDLWQPRAQLAKRRLRGFKTEHLVKFVAAAFSCRRWLRDTLINLVLVPRPANGHDLQPAQIDRANRVAYLRPMLPDGTLEDVSNKRCATVKFGPTFAKWLDFWDEEDKARPKWNDPQYVLFAGHRIESFDWVHRVARRAGITIPHGMGAYLFRHFMASYLVANGCPINQVKMLLGHDVVDGATAFYVELEPSFLALAAQLIEDLLHEIDRHLPRGMSLLIPASVPEEPAGRIAVMSDDSFFPDLEEQPLPDEGDGSDVWAGLTADRYLEEPELRGNCVAELLQNSKRIFNIEAPAVS